MTRLALLPDTEWVNTARSLLLYIVGISSALLLVLLTPISVGAYDQKIVGEVLGYPARAMTQIDGWGSVLKTDTSNNNIEETKTSDLTGETVIEVVGATNPDLKTKLDSTKNALESMHSSYSQMSSEAVLMGLKWDSLLVGDVTVSLDRLIGNLNNTGQLEWLTTAWGWAQLDALTTKVNQVKTSLATARSIVTTVGMQPVAYEQVKSAALQLDAIVDLIGNDSDTLRDRTIYSSYVQAEEAGFVWKTVESKLDEMIESGDYGDIESVSDQVLAQNKIAKIETLLASDAKNRVLDLLAIVDMNRRLLAGSRGVVQIGVWMRENPTRVVTLTYNPSLLSRQQVKVKYFLPGELSLEDIISSDPSLEVKYDEERKRLYVEGDLTIAAGDTRLVSIETRDVWKTADLGVEKMGIQAQELVSKLASSKNYVEAVELKSNIDVGVSEVVGVSSLLSPVERIVGYRKAVVRVGEMQKDLAVLQNMTLGKGNVLGWSSEFGYWKEVGVIAAGMLMIVIGGVGLSKSHSSGPKTEARKPRPMYQFSVFSTHVDAADM